MSSVKPYTFQRLMVLAGALCWHPVIGPNLGTSFEDWTPVDEIYGFLILKWVAVAWVKKQDISMIVPVTANRGASRIKQLWLPSFTTFRFLTIIRTSMLDKQFPVTFDAV